MTDNAPGAGRAVAHAVPVLKAVAVAVPTIALILGGILAVAYFVSELLRFPSSLVLPPLVRVFGAALVAAGVAVAGWLFRYRSPAAMIVSTYVTFAKLAGQIPLVESSGRAEPLIVAGPQKYTRNPLYFGVVLITFGWGLLGGETYVLVGSVLLLAWFRLILIPFEERELLALFGEQYEEYLGEVPAMVPFTKRKR
jgi:protein-S-isoprenylcysteine O-methyltransferase Ste14